MRIDWAELLFDLSFPALVVGFHGFLVFFGHWKSRIEAVAKETGGKVVSPRMVTGKTEGLPWRVLAQHGLRTNHPRWEIVFPSLKTIDFAIRVQSGWDRRLRKVGLLEDVEIGIPEFDARHLLTGPDPDKVGELFSDVAVLEAVKDLGVLEQWKSRRKEGHTGATWVLGGDGLAIGFDPPADGGFATFLESAVALAQALEKHPETRAVHVVHAEPVDRVRRYMGVLVIAAGLLALGFTAWEAVTVWTGAVRSVRFFLTMQFAIVGAGGLAVLATALRTRGQPWRHYHILAVSAVVAAITMIVPTVGVLINGAGVRGEEKTDLYTVTAVDNEAGKAGIEYREVTVADIGAFPAPPTRGPSIIRKGDRIEVTHAPGLLGVHRVLQVRDLPPAVEGDDGGR